VYEAIRCRALRRGEEEMMKEAGTSLEASDRASIRGVCGPDHGREARDPRRLRPIFGETSEE